jgi:catechol 2,3-dioxygenase-like lactoylglutathione lyase family enzyme
MESMKKLSPILWTKDLQETISFYENILGFKGRGNFPNFICLSKDDVEIMFVRAQNETEGPDKNGEDFFSKPVMTGILFITVEDADAIWEKIKDKVIIKSSIDNREYLVRDFSILDNNGYELVFGEDISNK